MKITRTFTAKLTVFFIAAVVLLFSVSCHKNKNSIESLPPETVFILMKIFSISANNTIKKTWKRDLVS